jgi:MFS family permease
VSNDPIANPGNVRALFRNGPFSRYIAGGAISLTGTWMQTMAQAWVVTTLTDKSLVLGITTFAGTVPMIALSLLGGTVADRYNKRNILLITQVVQILCALLVGWLVATGQIRIWHIIAVAIVLGSSASFEFPAGTAFVPELVGPDLIATAVAVDRSVFHGARLIGMSLAGYAIGQWGPASAFYANALSFVALIIALFTIRPVPATGPAQARGNIKEGFDYVRSDKPTLGVILLLTTTVICVFPVMVVLMPNYAKIVLHLPPKKMGLMMGLSAFGSLLGSIGLLGVPRAQRRKLAFVAVAGIALALTGLATARQFGFAVVSLVVLSLSVATIFGLTNTVAQERAPGPMRGRVAAIVGLSFFGLMPFAGLGITSLADWLGIRNALLIGGATFFATAIALLLGPARHINAPANEAAR